MTMFRCSNCSRIIEEGILIENHLTNDEYFVLEEVCPYCKNYIYEITEEGDENNN